MTEDPATSSGQAHVMPTYARLPVSFERGKGVWLYDQAGNPYLDALTGIAVCGLGHAHEGVQEAVAKQAGTLLHTSNLYEIDLQTSLAARLCEISGMDNVFFCNSGAEANEAAIKIARMYGHKLGHRQSNYPSDAWRLSRAHPRHAHRHPPTARFKLASSPSCQASCVPSSATWTRCAPPRRTPMTLWRS